MFYFLLDLYFFLLSLFETIQPIASYCDTALAAAGTGKQCQVEIPGSSNPRAGFLLLPGIIDTVR